MVQVPSKLQPKTLQPATAQAPAPEVAATPTLTAQPATAKPVAADGYRQATAPLQTLQPTTASLFADTKRIGTPTWHLDVANALTAGGKVQTPLSFGEKASITEILRKAPHLSLMQPDPQQPTAGMTTEQKAAYDALSPQDRARYDELHAEAAGNTQTGPFGTPEATPRSSVNQLRKLLTSGELGSFFKVEDSLGGANAEQAKTDLHEALFQGALGNKGNRGGSQSTLSYLAQLSDPKTQLLPGLDRQNFLAQVLHDVNHPEQIQQGEGNMNCGAINAAFYFAASNPTEYVRELTGLATKGQVQLDPLHNALKNIFTGKNEGAKLTFNGQIDPNSSTSLTSQLFGGAFSDGAKQTTSTTEPAKTTVGPDGTPQRTGLLGDKLHKLLRGRGRDRGIDGTQLANEMNQFGGPKWDTAFLPPANDTKVTPEQRAEARKTGEAVLQTASSNAPVFVNHNGHWLCVTKYDPATGEVQYYDPKQHRPAGSPPSIQTMKADDLFKGASDIVYQPGSAPDLKVPDYMHNTAWSRPGGGGSSTTGVGSGGGSGGNRTEG